MRARIEMPQARHERTDVVGGLQVGLAQEDTVGNGDLFDDSFLRDTRFKPRGRPEYEKKIDRYAVVIPPGTKGPIAVSAAVYYQSV